MTTQTRAERLKLTRESDGVAIDLRPLQGFWTEEQYLKLTDHTRHLVEFTDGNIEVLPMPTDKHQMILRFVFLALMAFVEPRGGRVLFAALRLRVRDDKFHEPDILLVRDTDDPRRQNRFWLGADLVVEAGGATVAKSCSAPLSEPRKAPCRLMYTMMYIKETRRGRKDSQANLP